MLPKVLADQINRAEAAWRAGELRTAYDIYAQALSARLSNTTTPFQPDYADIVAMDRLSDLAVLFGDVRLSQELLCTLTRLHTESGDQYAADYAALKRVHLAIEEGKLLQARELLQERTPTLGDIEEISFNQSGLIGWERARTWPNTGRADLIAIFSLSYLEFGRLLAAQGQYQLANTAIERGIFHCRSDGAPEIAKKLRADLELARAAALLEFGALAEARTQLLALRKSTDERRRPGVYVRALELTGKLDLLTGRLGDAQTIFQRIIEICLQGGFQKAVWTAQLNLAEIKLYLNQTAIAQELISEVTSQVAEEQDLLMRCRLLERLLHARGGSGADGIGIAPAVIEMASDNRRARGNVNRHAADPPAGAEEVPPQSANYLEWFETRALALQWALMEKRVPTALADAKRLEETFSLTDSPLILARLTVMKAMANYYNGDLAAAERLLTQGSTELSRLQLKPELWQATRMLGWCAKRLNREPEEREALAKRANKLLSELIESLVGIDRAFYVLNKWTADEEYLAVEIDQLVKMKRRYQAALAWRRIPLKLDLLKGIFRLLDHIEGYKKLLYENPQVGGLAKLSGQLSFQEILRRLYQQPRDQLTLIYLVLPDRIFFARLGRFTIDFGVSQISRIRMRELVRRWHELAGEIRRFRGIGALPEDKAARAANAPETSPDKIAERSEIANAIAEVLQLESTLAHLPARVRRLRVLADDVLNGFSFSSVKIGGKYLIESFAINHIFAIARPRRSSPPSSSLTVAVSKKLTPFPALPGTILEERNVSAWAQEQKISHEKLIDERADKATVLLHLSKVELFHIACHGIFKPDLPGESGLLLIDPADGNKGEVMTLKELAALDLRHLKHATLSACWSADYFALPGRWVFSIPETLCRAGSGSTLSCLWMVSDLVAVEFMKEFYRNLLTMTRDEALRQAQLKCLRKRLPLGRELETDDPIFWGGFILYGDNQKLF